ARPFLHPGPECGDDVRAQRGRARFSPFATTAQVGTAAQLDVAVAQAGELRDSQTGLQGDAEQRPVTSAAPARCRGACDQCVGLLFVEVADDGSIPALGGDVEHSGDERCVLWVAQGSEAEEAADGGQAGGAGAYAVVTFAFEMREELADQPGVE